MELLSSMRFAIALLTVIAICQRDRLLALNAERALSPTASNQFGPSWA
ncbi:hypothetical protein ACU4GD_36215 [Cupriavidus basilensis]